MDHFKHLIVPGVLLLTCAAGFSALGFWQLDRAAENRLLHDLFASGADEAPLRQLNANMDFDALRYRRVELKGAYLADRQILLDNMTHDGEAGYQVLTPLDIGDQPLVLVNRGWVRAGPDRSQLPTVPAPAGHAGLTGRIDRLPRVALTLEAGQPPAVGPLTVLSFPSPEDIAAVIGRPVYPFQVQLDADAPAGFVRDWAPAGIPPERNIAYAVQWFGLAALAIMIMVVLGWRSLRGQRAVAP